MQYLGTRPRPASYFLALWSCSSHFCSLKLGLLICTMGLEMKNPCWAAQESSCPERSPGKAFGDGLLLTFPVTYPRRSWKFARTRMELFQGRESYYLPEQYFIFADSYDYLKVLPSTESKYIPLCFVSVGTSLALNRKPGIFMNSLLMGMMVPFTIWSWNLTKLWIRLGQGVFTPLFNTEISSEKTKSTRKYR